MSKLSYIIALLALASKPSLGQSANQAHSRTTIDFAAFTDLVEKNHPENLIDKFAVDRSVQSEAKAGLLPDPEIAVGRDQIPLEKKQPMAGEMVSESEEMWRLNITQMFPWPGSLPAEESAAAAVTRRVKATFNISAAERIFEAKDFFLRLVTAAKFIEVNRENLQAATAILKNAQTRLRHGIGTHHDLIQAQNERAVLALNLSAMEVDLENFRDHAAQMIGQIDASGIEFILEYPYSYLAESPSKTSTTIDLKKDALTARRNADAAGLEVERKKTMPRLMTSGMLMQEDSGMRMYGFMAGITIPLYSSRARSAVESQESLLSSQMSEELAWHDKRKNLALTQNERRQKVLAANVLGLETEIIPNARQHLKTLTIEYGQGKSSFSGVNNARRQLLRYHLAESAAKRDLALSRVAREKIGAGLFEMELDKATPQLPAAEMASGMDPIGAANMDGNMGDETMRKDKGRKPASNTLPKTSLEEDSSSGNGGMGGMNGM